MDSAWPLFPSRLKHVCSLVALLGALTHANRDDSGYKSVSLTRDGHFQLATDEPAEPPVTQEAKSSAASTRQIRALHPVEPPTIDKRSTEFRVGIHEEGGWYNSRQQRPKPSASSFANRTDNWMTLSQMASGSLSSTHIQIATPRPTVPPERYKSRPKSWPMRAWNEYERAYDSLKDIREGPGHHLATAAAVLLGPDSCVLKILYVFFSKTGEDDYPYVPRGCGDMFDFAMNANSIPVPWMLIVGALFIVTGTHTSINAFH